MNKQSSKVLTSTNKSYIRSMIAIIIIFLITGISSVIIINRLFYDEIKKDSVNIAKNYTNELSNSKVARDTINSLIDNRLELTVKIVSNYSQNPTIDLLKEIAGEYDIREINVFNQDGEIYSSNIPDLVGWQMNKEHPAYGFLKDGNEDNIFIEDIRKDLHSDYYMKYTYSRNTDGDLVQIGITADIYYNLIEHFQIYRTIAELNNFNNIMGAQFIDNSLNIVSKEGFIENHEFKIDDDKVKAIGQDVEYYNRTESSGEDVYEVMIPVYNKTNNSKLGTLAISYRISGLVGTLRHIYIISMVLLIGVFLLIARGVYITNQKNKKLIELAYYDQITGLPNLDYLVEFYRETISERVEQDGRKKSAIILIDIDDINLVLLTYGYDQTESMFIQISNQIKSLLTNNEKLFRIAESKFAIYVEDYRNKEYFIDISSKINSLVKSDKKDSKIPNHLTVKIGINKIKVLSEDILDIIKNAQIAANTNIALNSDYDSNCEFFNDLMEEEIIRINYIENEIEKFIKEESNSIYLNYQPQLDLRTNKISGFEALARMKTDKLGQVSPHEFITIAEQSNMIIGLGLILLREACLFINEISNKGFKELKVAVNVSAIQVLRDDFHDSVMKVIKETNIEPRNLELEITESEFLDNFDIVNNNLIKLANEGITIAIDDFGTGYSSLERLKRLNADRLKIDKSFIDRIATSNPEELITGVIISLAHKTGLEVVAEGVEQQEQKDYLIDNNCDIMQGYLFSKPVSQKKALQMLKEES